MYDKLVIVESPSKSKTIENYLGKEYHVTSSKGHIRDLSTSGKEGLGIDQEDHYKPKYVISKDKKDVVKELKAAVKEAKTVYLATDPDREGEAISWHLADVLGLDMDDDNRIVFNEVTKDAVVDALNHPRKIDQNLVKSQETRRVLDRIIGFKLSKLLQRKIKSKSAGRVQSVALRLIVEKEREIEAFVPEEYWKIKAQFEKDEIEFTGELNKKGTKKLKISNEQEALEIFNALSKEFVIDSVKKSSKKRESKPPFITSTLQQEASSKLGFKARKTMMIAQKLYEGIALEDETVGLITYMRTDSTRLSDLFVESATEYIKEKYGQNYVGKVKVSKKKENVQDAHEGIRPTSAMRTPESVKEYLSADEFKLYSLIYARALASLMAPSRFDATSVVLENNNYYFNASGSVLKFDGYLRLYSPYEKQKDEILPELTEQEILESQNIEKTQHFTKPPARFTESSLIKELESLGIGRPSTYATIISTIKDRGYVTIEDKKFVPTEVGFETTDKLQEFFSSIVNVKYTANMEKDLDEIAEGNEDYKKMLKEFYDNFAPLVDNAFKNMEKKKPEETGEKCPECGSPLVIRKGKYGQFTACSNYPTCKYIKKENKQIEKEIICKCPKCEGNIIVRKTKKGKEFYGCDNFPKCKYASWYKPTGDKCPKCNDLLVIKNGEVICPTCDE